jgi:DNA-binding NarL/FixJ family response regulator
MVAHSRIVLADDHPLIRHAVRDYMERSPDLQIVAELEQGQGLEQAIQEKRPDLLILDLSMESGFKPVQAVRRLREMQPQLKVLVLSAHNEPRWIIEMLEAGVDAYVHKSEPLHTLIPVIRRVLDGETWYSHCLLQQVASEYWHDKSLASHERMVLQVIADGGDLVRLAKELNVSERTITRYLSLFFAPYKSNRERR